MKKLLFLFFLIISLPSYGQSDKYRHGASLEFLGLGGSLSVRYDYMFNHSPRGFFNASLGVGGFSTNPVTFFSLPHSVSYNFGRSNRFFEVGVGGTYAYTDAQFTRNENFPVAVYTAGPTFGYRSITKTGFQFRVYATAFVSDERVLPWIGFGFGKAFRKKK